MKKTLPLLAAPSLAPSFTLSLALSLATIALPAAALDPRPVEPAAKAHYQATRQYYQDLIAGAGPVSRLSELTLLMNMMPKGGDLHHHYSGAIYAETYLDWGERMGYCIYRSSDLAIGKEKYRFETKPPALPSGPALPNNAPVAAGNCISVDAARKDTAFYRELLAQWSTMDYHNHGQLQAPPDQHFFNTFGYFGAVSGYDYKLGFQQLKKRAKAENVQYIETMVKDAPPLENAVLGAAIDALTTEASDDKVNAALEAFVNEMQSSLVAQQTIANYVRALEGDADGVDDADFRLRMQAYVSRNNTPSKVFSSMYTAFAASARSRMIVGVNIVGPEHGVVALRDYSLHMRMFRFLKKRFEQVKLALHAGELAPGLVPPEALRNHISEAVYVASARRIGHGVDIVHESNADQLLGALKSEGIAVEINLTSNDFILGVQGAAHPVTTYMRFGVPIVLSTDDAGVSRNDLSGEYALFASRYRPSYDTLKQVVYNSIRYSFMAQEDKAAEVRKLDARFQKFEQAVAALVRSSP